MSRTVCSLAPQHCSASYGTATALAITVIRLCINHPYHGSCAQPDLGLGSQQTCQGRHNGWHSNPEELQMHPFSVYAKGRTGTVYAVTVRGRFMRRCLAFIALGEVELWIFTPGLCFTRRAPQ